MDATKSTGISNATEKKGNLLDRTKKRVKRVKLRARLSHVETSIGRNSRNPLTSGQEIQCTVAVHETARGGQVVEFEDR